MDDEQDPWVDWLLDWPFNLRWYAIKVIVGLIVVVSLGFWQLIVTVADHQRGQLGDGRGYDGPCRASTPDAAGCRLPPGPP
jgi:hypothetical protein